MKFGPPIILTYNQKGEILPKERFTKNEFGCIGIYHENWIDRGYPEQDLWIFGQSMESFDAPSGLYAEFDLDNHRFHRYLRDNVKNTRMPTFEECDRTWKKLDYYFNGGIGGDYRFVNGVLHITPTWKGRNRGTSCFDEGFAEYFGKQLVEREDFKLDKFKVKKGLHDLVF